MPPAGRYVKPIVRSKRAFENGSDFPFEPKIGGHSSLDRPWVDGVLPQQVSLHTVRLHDEDVFAVVMPPESLAACGTTVNLDVHGAAEVGTEARGNPLELDVVTLGVAHGKSRSFCH